MVTLMQTTVKIIPLMVTLMQTVLVLKIPEANDIVTDNVKAADFDIADSDYNAADDDDADNADAIPNARDGVIDDIYDNDYGIGTKNSYISDPDDTDAQHKPIFCLVWSSIAWINWARCARLILSPWQGADLFILE